MSRTNARMTNLTWPELWATLRVQHVLTCLSSFYSACCFEQPTEVHGGLSLGGRWWPDLAPCTARRGGFGESNGQGANIGVLWDERGVVGLVFDKDSDRNEAAGGHIPEDRYQPLRWLEGLPEGLAPIARDLAGVIGNLATAGFWAEAGRPITRSSGNSVDTHDWFHLLNGPSGPLANLEVQSLDPEHGEVALALAQASLAGPHVVNERERAVLLTIPAEWNENAELNEAGAIQVSDEALASLATALALVEIRLDL